MESELTVKEKQKLLFSKCEFTAMDEIFTIPEYLEALTDLAKNNKFELTFKDKNVQGIIFSGANSTSTEYNYESPLISYFNVIKNIQDLIDRQRGKLRFSFMSTSKTIHTNTIQELESRLNKIKSQETKYTTVVSKFIEFWRKCFEEGMQGISDNSGSLYTFDDLIRDYQERIITMCGRGGMMAMSQNNCKSVKLGNYLFHSIIDYLCATKAIDGSIDLLNKYGNLSEYEQSVPNLYKKIPYINKGIENNAVRFQEKKAIQMQGIGGRRTKHRKSRMGQSAKKMRLRQNTKLNKRRRRQTHKRR